MLSSHGVASFHQRGILLSKVSYSSMTPLFSVRSVTLHPWARAAGGGEEQEAGRCQAGCQGQPVLSSHGVASFHQRGILPIKVSLVSMTLLFSARSVTSTPWARAAGGREEQEAGRCQAGCQGQPVVSPHGVASFHQRGILAIKVSWVSMTPLFLVRSVTSAPWARAVGAGRNRSRPLPGRLPGPAGGVAS